MKLAILLCRAELHRHITQHRELLVRQLGPSVSSASGWDTLRENPVVTASYYRSGHQNPRNHTHIRCHVYFLLTSKRHVSSPACPLEIRSVTHCGSLLTLRKSLLIRHVNCHLPLFKIQKYPSLSVNKTQPGKDKHVLWHPNA